MQRTVWLCGLSIWLGCGQELADPAGPPRPPPDAPTLTLLTGDRVALIGSGDAIDVRIEPGPGRASVPFRTLHHEDEILVIPRDVEGLIASDRLDRALFDVSRLIADGYGDDRCDDLPVIATGATASASARMARPGVIVDRAMPVLRTVALRERKAAAGGLIAQLRGPDGPAKLWLDRAYRPLLDRSVPQVGAPAAHARGFTGAGVTVAVLDTGIDAEHPDLAGKVVEAREFLGDGHGTSDVFGHATHVASIVAGSGAASGGQFRGVAPDAQLLSGRVCDEVSCPGSAILAGMEWAVVERGARIVNISLGASDQPGLDPIEQAVEQLSATHGALFVVSAGNDGPIDQTVTSPGSADAALTVGAVDHDDAIALFSGRGPRTEDSGLKPDVTAPGVDIVAARAAVTGEALGEPVGTSYIRVSGTSMAAPHVAGAAALVLQQHPDWTGAQLKAALIASAAPDPALTAFDQGAGRIDVDRATRQAVTVDPPSVSLGRAVWPHDDDEVLVRTVRYRNLGAAPTALAIEATLAQPDGAPAAGMIALDASSITIPAGGSADVVVTVDPRGDRPEGRYSGALVATAGDVRVVTPIALDREVESYDLTLRARDSAGAPTLSTVFLWRVGPATPSELFFKLLRFLPVDGDFTVRLPRATYTFIAALESEEDDDGERTASVIAYPRFALTRDTTVDVDERQARPVAPRVAGAHLTQGPATAVYRDALNRFTVTARGNPRLATAQLGPDAPAGEVDGALFTSAVPEGASSAPSEVYSFGRRTQTGFFTGWDQTFQPRELATVRAEHVGRRSYRKAIFSVLDGVQQIQSRIPSVVADYQGPFTRTEHYTGDGIVWIPELSQLAPDRTRLSLLSASQRYRPGPSVERWDQAPYGPSFADHNGRPGASRTADIIAFDPSMFSDRTVPSRAGSSLFDTERTRIFRNGQLVTEINEHPLLPNFRVPAAPTTFRFERETARGAPFELSTRVSAAWTFASQHVDGTAALVLPLPTLRFLPLLDRDDRAPGPLTVLPIAIERPRGAATPRITSATVDASFDDGATWSGIPVLLLGDAALGVVVHPPRARFVSLRGTVRDVDGNQGELSIIRAYRIGR